MLNEQSANTLQKSSVNDTTESQITLFKLQKLENLFKSKSATINGILSLACSETLENECQLFRSLVKINLTKISGIH